MKNLYFLLICMAGFASAKTQTLFSYGNNQVSTDEFLRAYNKNKVPVSDKRKAMREYLDLYTNFKLKVEAANELRLDTLTQIKVDIANFRDQVEENYMSDEKGQESLMQEAIQRSFKELHVLHFTVPVPEGSLAVDTATAYKNINTVYNDLKKGNKNYREIADKASVKYNDVGYMTAFSLPYNFENIIYSLKPGEVSTPYRTRSAWHIFKIADVRNNTGKWKVSQILFSLPPSAADRDREQIKKKADSVYKLLNNGADFATAAKQFSEDKLTYLTGGELPEFAAGKYDRAFEEEVMKLKTDGSISKPFATPFGYHIVKRIAHTPGITDATDPTLQYQIKEKLLKDARIESAKAKFAEDLISKTGMKETKAVKEADLFRYADSVMRNPTIENAARFPISNKEIIRFKNGTLTGADWMKFVVEYKGNFNTYKGESNAALWKKYLEYAANEYYKQHLENYNDDFLFQMKEFREGNMLFEIMERNVWGKAGNDSAGLINYYNAHKAKYIWPASADVLIFNASDEKIAKEILEIMQKERPWRQVADAYAENAQADSGRYEISQLPASVNTPAPGTYSSIIKNADGTALFIKYLRIYPAGQQRTFEEAKGLVINDYQGLLEEQWLAKLRKKYPVKINEDAFNKLVK